MTQNTALQVVDPASRDHVDLNSGQLSASKPLALQKSIRDLLISSIFKTKSVIVAIVLAFLDVLLNQHTLQLVLLFLLGQLSARVVVSLGSFLNGSLVLFLNF